MGRRRIVSDWRIAKKLGDLNHPPLAPGQFRRESDRMRLKRFVGSSQDGPGISRANGMNQAFHHVCIATAVAAFNGRDLNVLCLAVDTLDGLVFTFNSAWGSRPGRSCPEPLELDRVGVDPGVDKPARAVHAEPAPCRSECGHGKCCCAAACKFQRRHLVVNDIVVHIINAAAVITGSKKLDTLLVRVVLKPQESGISLAVPVKGHGIVWALFGYRAAFNAPLRAPAGLLSRVKCPSDPNELTRRQSLPAR